MSMIYKARGKVAAILPVESFPSGFQKQTLVVTDEDPRYPQRVAVEFFREKISLLQGLRQGQDVEVDFCLSGREYNGRHYVSLRGVSVAAVRRVAVQGGVPTAATAANAPNAPAAPPAAAAADAAAADDLSDLPF